MTQMLRKQIYIEKRQQTLLKRLARKRGVSEAEIIRQAIDREAGNPAPVLPLDHDAWEQARAFMWARRKLGGQGQPYRWQRADAYDDRLERVERHVRDQGEA